MEKENKKEIDVKQQEMQQKYMEINYMQQHLEQYTKQLDVFENQLNEIDMIMEALDTINTKEQGSEILVPISNGIFAKGKLDNNNSLIVNVGSNIAVEKDVEGTKALLEKQKSEISSAKLQINGVISTLTGQMQAVENDLKEFVKAE